MAKKATAAAQAEKAEGEVKTARQSPAKKTAKAGGKAVKRSPAKRASGGKAAKAAGGSAAAATGFQLPNFEIPEVVKDFGTQIAKMMDTDVGRVIMAELLVQTAKALSRSATAREAVASATNAVADAGTAMMEAGTRTVEAGAEAGTQVATTATDIARTAAQAAAGVVSNVMMETAKRVLPESGGDKASRDEGERSGGSSGRSA